MKIEFIGFKDSKFIKKIKEFIAKQSKKRNISKISPKENKVLDVKERKVLMNLKETPKVAYLLLSLMIMVCFFSLTMTVERYKETSKEDYISYKYEDNAVAVNSKKNNAIIEENVIEASSISTDIANYEVKTVATVSQNVQKPVENNVKETKEEYKYEYVKPIDGETLKEYSMDKVVYSKTLDMWKVHDGIDILSAIGADVRSVEKGIVEKVYKDSFYGFSVILDHQNGIKTIYRNLQDDILVKEGETIKKERILGKVGNTAIGEIKDEPHLHFEVIQNGEIVNPSIIGIK